MRSLTPPSLQILVSTSFRNYGITFLFIPQLETFKKVLFSLFVVVVFVVRWRVAILPKCISNHNVRYYLNFTWSWGHFLKEYQWCSLCELGGVCEGNEQAAGRVRWGLSWWIPRSFLNWKTTIYLNSNQRNSEKLRQFRWSNVMKAYLTNPT